MKAFFSALMLTLAFSAAASITPEQARADLRGLIKPASIKGEVIHSPSDRYNTTLVMSERSYRQGQQQMEIDLFTPIYSVSYGIVREQGHNRDAGVLIDNDTYMITKDEAVRGGLTLVTYKVRNKKAPADTPSRVYVSKQEITVATRANGTLVRVSLKVEERGETRSYIFQPKNWQAPTRL